MFSSTKANILRLRNLNAFRCTRSFKKQKIVKHHRRGIISFINSIEYVLAMTVSTFQMQPGTRYRVVGKRRKNRGWRKKDWRAKLAERYSGEEKGWCCFLFGEGIHRTYHPLFVPLETTSHCIHINIPYVLKRWPQALHFWQSSFHSMFFIDH